MSIRLRHAKVVAAPDSNDGKVSTNAWNDQHVLTGTANMLLGFDTSGNATEIDPITISTGGPSSAVVPVADRTILAALSTLTPAYLKESGREGTFVWSSANNATNVTNDPNQGIYVAPASDTTGASGAWIRADRETVSVFWFMSAAEVADVRAFAYSVNATNSLNAAAQYIQNIGGGTLLFPRGGYLIGTQTFQGTLLDGVTNCAYGAHEVVTIKNCTNAVKLSGYGAVLKTAAGLKWGAFDRSTGLRYDPPSMPFQDYDYYGYIFRAMINVEGNTGGVAIEGFELDGNNTLIVLGGTFGDSDRQLEGHGIWAKNNGFTSLKDLYIHHQTTDGIVVSTASSQAEGAVRQPVEMDNVRCRYNGRNGISPVGVNQMTITNTDLSNQGQALNTVSSELVRSSPGAGIDIEANASRNRNIILDNITAIGNYQSGITAASGDSRGVTVRRSKVEGIVLARPDFTFEDCTLIGYCNPAGAQTDQYKTTSSAVTLTIAGTGPYTITRSAGDFTADGWVAGNMCQLSGSGLSAGNKNRNLQITGVTSTVLTVVCLGQDRTMVAEGPIASCTVATAMTKKDGQRFLRCRFTYDATLTESGTLQNSAQSNFNQMTWGEFTECVWQCGSVDLPNFNSVWGSVVDRSYPLIHNCDFYSTGSTTTNIYGRFQGRNHIEAPNATVSIGLNNTRGRFESGDMIINGTSQRKASKTFDPPSVASGASTTTTVTYTGAAVGDQFVAAFSNSLSGLVLTAYVSAANTVTTVFFNPTGGAVDLASGTLTVTKVI
jgi:hypothetical protein